LQRLGPAADHTRRREGADDSALVTRAVATPGEALDRDTSAFMTSRFGHDFSRVRIHRGPTADASARAVSALAYTVGRDVVFADGQYAPGTDTGRRTLAHELTHVIQQQRGQVDGSPVQARLRVSDPSDRFEREADSMAGRVMASTGCVAGRAGAVQQGVAGLVDVPEETSQSEVEEPGPVVLTEPGPVGETETDLVAQTIQRSATWKAATVHETRNAAELALGGDAPVTWETLNGTMLKTVADCDSAIKIPGVTTAGSGAAWTAKVDTVPAQEGSDDETVLGPGPWSKITTKAAAGAVTAEPACAGAGASTLSVHGRPSDDAVYKANRRHEDHHVADHKASFATEVGAWDKKVQDAKDKGTEFKGATAAAATTALWAAMGNTPQKAARSFQAKNTTKGAAYHATPAGGPMSLSNPAANADCSASSVDVTNPA